MKTKNESEDVRKILAILTWRMRKAKQDVKKYNKKDTKWTAMKDQARGSYWEAFMAVKAVREFLKG